MLSSTFRAKPDLYEKSKPASDRSSVEQVYPPTHAVTKPTLWIELLPLGLQYRIAQYVCEGIPGRNALNLASCTPQTAEAVSVALDHYLLDFNVCRTENRTQGWVQHFPNVRVLELWEHPNNFELLKSPKLHEVILEDDPFQVSALANSRVNVERIEFYVRYGTPTNVIVDMFSKISFTDLEFGDTNDLFFQHVDVDTFAEACKSVTSLEISVPSSAQQPLKRFIQRLPNLKTLILTIDKVFIKFEDRIPEHHETPIVSDFGRYRRPIPWFETLVQPEQLRSLWLASARGWGEKEVLQFAAIVMDLPNLTGLSVAFRGGSERFFPSVSSVTRFRALWDDCLYLPEGDEIYYTPEKGTVAKMIRGLPNLQNLRLHQVALDDEEVTQIIASVGNTVETMRLPIWRQRVNPMERLLVIIQALTRYTKCLEVFGISDKDDSEQEPSPLSKPIKRERKREILKYVDRLFRLVPDLGFIEMHIMDYPEEQDEEQDEEDALQKYFTLRRIRKAGLYDDTAYMCGFAKLLETGCEGLPQNREAALQLYKSAVESGELDPALLNLWRLTEDPKDFSTEPKPGGAFELILELDKTGVQKVTDTADLFLYGGLTPAEPIPSAAVKFLQHVIDRGFTYGHCKKLALLLERGDDDVPSDPERAFALFKLAIDDHNDPTAIFCIASMLKHGFGDRKPDPAAAREYLERGARLEWSPCINDLALLISQGYGDIPPDYPAAIKLYKSAIAYGNIVSMINLARLYVEQGDRDLVITQKAIALYERAISEGQSSLAMVLLASLYQNGCNGMAPNPARAKELYIQAIEHDDTSAFISLGNLVCDGYDDKPPDPDEAMRLFQLAIDTGDKVTCGMAYTAYAELMETGRAHVEADVVKAVEYYRHGVRNDNLRAINLLAMLLDEGRSNLVRDSAEACRLLERGIELGSTDSMLALCNILQRDGGGSEQSLTRAKELCTDALNAGSIKAYPALGHMLEFGLGCDGPDPERAAELYKKGMAAGDVGSIVLLGALYERGFGQQCPDPLRSITYYDLGIVRHDSWFAKCHLGFLDEEGYLQEAPAYQLAMEIYESASESGDPWASVFKGMLIERGYDDKEPDPERARTIYEKAVQVTTDTRSVDVNVYALGRLGRLIEKNSGDDPMKLREAADLYKKAIAKRKESTALTYLAGLALKGYEGVDADIPQVVSMLEEAIEYGTFAPPCFLLASCLEKGYGDVEPNPERAEILEEQGCFIMMNPSAKIWKPWQRLRPPALYQA